MRDAIGSVAPLLDIRWKAGAWMIGGWKKKESRRREERREEKKTFHSASDTSAASADKVYSLLIYLLTQELNFQIRLPSLLVVVPP